jgi:hypothetical protein
VGLSWNSVATVKHSTPVLITNLQKIRRGFEQKVTKETKRQGTGSELELGCCGETLHARTGHELTEYQKRI